MLLWPFNKYPGTDYETFNWEWILKTVKDYTQKVDDFIEDITDTWNGFRDGIIDTWNDFKDWTTGEINQMHDDFADYVNVTEGALNTGAIANGAITKQKINTDFLLEIEKDYVTPQMYGAVADGVTDDSQAFIDAFAACDNVKLPDGEYYINNTVTIPDNGALSGINSTGAYIKSSGVTAFSIGEGVTLKDFRCDGNGTGTAITGRGYRLKMSGVVINEYQTGINCTAGLMLANINNCRFRKLDDAIIINDVSNMNVFIDVWCGYCNTFIKDGKSGLIACECWLFVGCTFEGVDATHPKITVVYADSTHRIAPQNITFETCYFESNAAVIPYVHGGNINFNACWFYYNVDVTEYYLDVYNEVSIMICYVNVSNCYVPSSIHGDKLVGTSRNVIYKVDNCNQTVGNLPDTYFNTDQAYVSPKGMKTILTQTSDIAPGDSETFAITLPIADGKPHNYLIVMAGQSSTVVWQYIGMLMIGPNNTTLVPIITKNCTVAYSANQITYTNDSAQYTQSVSTPFKMVMTEVA